MPLISLYQPPMMEHYFLKPTTNDEKLFALANHQEETLSIVQFPLQVNHETETNFRDQK